MPTVTLACKGGIVLSKPIIPLEIVENLRQVSANQCDKSFAELFQKQQGNHKLTFRSTTSQSATAFVKAVQNDSGRLLFTAVHTYIVFTIKCNIIVNKL